MHIAGDVDELKLGNRPVMKCAAHQRRADGEATRTVSIASAAQKSWDSAWLSPNFTKNYTTSKAEACGLSPRTCLHPASRHSPQNSPAGRGPNIRNRHHPMEKFVTSLQLLIDTRSNATAAGRQQPASPPSSSDAGSYRYVELLLEKSNLPPSRNVPCSRGPRMMIVYAVRPRSRTMPDTKIARQKYQVTCAYNHEMGAGDHSLPERLVPDCLANAPDGGILELDARFLKRSKETRMYGTQKRSAGSQQAKFNPG